MGKQKALISSGLAMILFNISHGRKVILELLQQFKSDYVRRLEGVVFEKKFLLFNLTSNLT
jgi:hypothetical protein